MEKIKNLMSRWVFTLLAAVLVLTGLVGCSSQDVETALDVAIGVLEVAEALEKESEIENDVTPSVTELSSESQSPTEEIETEIEPEADKEEPVIDEDGHYTSKEESLSIFTPMENFRQILSLRMKRKNLAGKRSRVRQGSCMWSRLV